jgi:cytochrome c551/c552
MTGLRRHFKAVLLGFVVVVVGAQLVPVARTNPPVTGDVAAPPEVAALLRRACYDCHSNETVWPWYSRVAPVAWLVSHDVSEGREELNFSAWGDYPAKRRAKKLKESREEVEDGEMPPWYYLLMHPEARLDDAERARLLAWTAEAAPAP